MGKVRDSGLLSEIIAIVERNVAAESREPLYEELLDAFENFDQDIYVDECYGQSDALDKLLDERYYDDDLYDDLEELELDDKK